MGIRLYKEPGLEKPDISIYSPEFLEEMRNLPQKNLAVELLRKLIDGEIKRRSKKNLVQSKAFSERLESTIKRYHNRTIETVKIIEELINLARQIDEANRRGEDLGLTEEEIAFYDALETDDNAVKVLGNDTLRTIAREITEAIRRNVTVDWTLRENIQAKLRVLVKRILRKYKYPREAQNKAAETVLAQASLMFADWGEIATVPV